MNEKEYQKRLKEALDARTPLSLVPLQSEEAISLCNNEYGMNAILRSNDKIIFGKLRYENNQLVLYPQNSTRALIVNQSDEIYWIGLKG